MASLPAKHRARRSGLRPPWLRLRRSRRKKSQVLEAGDVVAGRYRVESRLGAGGMALVYRAFDMELDEPVALKFLRREVSDDEGAFERLKQEIKLARKVVHTGVCRTYDLGTWVDERFVTMEFLDGQTLQHWLEIGGPIDLDERVGLLRGIAAGLDAAHRQGIVHRDLKPQNIMVTSAGRPVIMDFGIARELSASESDEEEPGDHYGTPAYMAPETISRQVSDERSDLYSLGIILFELITGLRPFSGATLIEVARKQLQEPAPPPSSFNRSVPEWLDRVVLRLLEKDPSLRYQSLAEMMADLPEVEWGVTKTVLLVDDDPVIIELLKKRLESKGIEVRTAKDGGEGIEAILSEPPDLLCVDLAMPVMDGFDMLTYLHHQGMRERFPVFMWTSVEDPQYERQAFRLGVEKFFRKPVELQAVADQIFERVSVIV